MDLDGQLGLPFEVFNVDAKLFPKAFNIPSMEWYLIAFYNHPDPDTYEPKSVKALNDYRDMKDMEEAAQKMCIDTKQ